MNKYVFCKIPNGIIFDFIANDEQIVVELKGPSKALFVDNGFGVNTVNAEEWAEVEKKFGKTHPAFTNKAIYATDKPEAGKAQAKELKNQKSGFERIDPDKPGMGVEQTDKKELKPQKKTSKEG